MVDDVPHEAAAEARVLVARSDAEGADAADVVGFLKEVEAADIREGGGVVGGNSRVDGDHPIKVRAADEHGHHAGGGFGRIDIVGEVVGGADAGEGIIEKAAILGDMSGAGRDKLNRHGVAPHAGNDGRVYRIGRAASTMKWLSSLWT
jgi:hypothetical protein